MNLQRPVGLLLVTSFLSVAGPSPLAGQSTPSAASERDQAVDNMARERTVAFCSYLAEQKQAGKPIPPGDLSFSGFGGSNWVFKGSEIQTLTKKCDQLMALMRQLK